MAMAEKIIRDPVHDVIAFDMQRPVDALLFGLINAREFQRLRRISQLGMASLVYPGAGHSRYSHSLGVMETARKILGRLGESFEIDAAGRTACLVAALLHDLGHGPYSHVFERVTGVEHEELTKQVILDSSSEVNGLLVAFDRTLPGRVAGMIACETGKGRGKRLGAGRDFFCDILSSQLDADRMDYLLRDNLMTGSRYGGYDLRWLLHALTLAPDPGGGAEEGGALRLVVAAKGVSAVETYLQARYHMYRNVYFHKVVRSGEGMLRLILRRARELAGQGRLPGVGASEPITKALGGEKLSATEFTELDDVSLVACFKLWARCEDAILARLCEGLLYRQLFKTVDLSRIEDPKRLATARAAAEAALKKAGGDVVYDMVYDEPAEVAYERPADQAAKGATTLVGGEEILIQQAGGGLVPFAEVSPMSVALGRQLTFRRLHVAGKYRDVVRDAVAGC
jgi:HD superfamily phosphohydrolase